MSIALVALLLSISTGDPLGTGPSDSHELEMCAAPDDCWLVEALAPEWDEESGYWRVDWMGPLPLGWYRIYAVNSYLRSLDHSGFIHFCDTDGDGIDNRVDADFNQDDLVDGFDALILIDDLLTGVDSGVGTNMNCNGGVDGSDINLFIPLLIGASA